MKQREEERETGRELEGEREGWSLREEKEGGGS
jgi:hypothetical protein